MIIRSPAESKEEAYSDGRTYYKGGETCINNHPPYKWAHSDKCIGCFSICDRPIAYTAKSAVAIQHEQKEETHDNA